MAESEILKVEFISGTKFAQKMTCTLCGEVVYQVGPKPTEAECTREAVGVGAHMEFRHNLTFHLVRCSDPDCGKVH